MLLQVVSPTPLPDCLERCACLPGQLHAFPDRPAFPTRLPQLYKEICGLLAAGNKTALRQLVRAALTFVVALALCPVSCIAEG